MNYEKNENQKSDRVNLAKPVAILFSGLFVIALIGVVYLLVNNNKLSDTQAGMETQIEDLNVQREDLRTELQTIETSFDEKITENEELSVTLEERVKEVEALEWKLQDARKRLTNSEAENETIKSKLATLEEMKTELQSDIAALGKTNSDLKKVNAEIKEQLEMSNEYAMSLNAHLVDMSDTNKKLMNRLYTIAPAGFIAENFVVTSEKRNDKLTSKARRTDEVKVSFDINNVPKDYFGDEEIYLVFAQFDGQPVAEIPTKKVRIASREPFDIKAASVEKLKLNNKQNIEMSIDADKNLDAGTYNLLVYADHGFLGATSFQLR